MRIDNADIYKVFLRNEFVCVFSIRQTTQKRDCIGHIYKAFLQYDVA